MTSTACIRPTHTTLHLTDTSETTSELELIRKAKRGDREALGELVEIYLPNIKFRAEIANKRNSAIGPDEIVSGTLDRFENLIKNFDLSKSNKLGPTLNTTMRNVELDLLRRLSKQRDGLVEYQYVHRFRLESLEKPDVVAEALDSDLLSKLILALSDNEAAVIKLTLEGLTPDEIATELNITRDSVYQRKSGAIKNMQEALPIFERRNAVAA